MEFQENKPEIIYAKPEGITFKELVELIKTHFFEWLRHWLVIGICAAVGSALFLYLAYTTPVKYTGSVTFSLSESDGGSSGLLSQFTGILGISGGSSTNLAKIMEISKSKKVVYETLMDTIEVKGVRDIIANHIINYQKLHEMSEWEHDEDKEQERGFRLDSFYFKRTDIEKFNKQEYMALFLVQKIALGGTNVSVDDVLFASEFSDLTGIMKISVTSRAEELSMGFVNQLFDRLDRYYITSTMEKQEKTLNVLTHRTDSLQRALVSKEISSARFQDRNTALLFKEDKTTQDRLDREKLILSGLYSESVKNKELMRFSLLNSSPLIQVIDKPYPPLEPITKSLPVAIVLGALVGAFLCASYYSFKLFWNKKMQE